MYLWRDVKFLAVPHTWAGSGSHGSWILLAASSHLSQFKYDGSPAARSPGKGSFGDVRGQQGCTILKCLLKQAGYHPYSQQYLKELHPPPCVSLLNVQPTACHGTSTLSFSGIHRICSLPSLWLQRATLKGALEASAAPAVELDLSSPPWDSVPSHY